MGWSDFDHAAAQWGLYHSGYGPHSGRGFKTDEEYQAFRKAEKDAEKRRVEKANAIREKRLQKCMSDRDAANMHPVFITSKRDESYDCQIIVSRNIRAERKWAVVGEQCFPVKQEYVRDGIAITFDLAVDLMLNGEQCECIYILDGTPVPLDLVVNGGHCTKGYEFV